MSGSKMVLFVPDAPTRERVRSIADSAPIEGLQLSICIATPFFDTCVRDTRRALFEGPLAVLTRDQDDVLCALSAGADEAQLLDDSFAVAALVHLVQRTRLRCAARREVDQRLAAISEFERLCALGRLVTGVAEELSDPLSTAMISLQLLRNELEPLYAIVGRLREQQALNLPVSATELPALLARVRSCPGTAGRAQAMLADVSEACESIAQVARELGLGAADHPERPEFFSLQRMLELVLRLFERAIGRGTQIDRDFGEELPDIFAPRARVAQTLISLLSNALARVRKVESKPRLRIALRANERAVTLSVSDSGPGVTPALLERLLAPSANSNGSHGQSGIGVELGVARSTLRGLGGDLLVESLGGDASTFVAWFPRPPDRDARASQSGIAPKPTKPTAEAPHLVMVLEPDANVLFALSRLLGERYEIALAQDGREAQRLFSAGARPDAILVAVDDPDGPNFVRWLFDHRPELVRKLLLTCSQPDLPDDVASLPCLSKPLEPLALYRGLEERFAPHLRSVRAESKTARQAS